jgi:hypothetical protein
MSFEKDIWNPLPSYGKLAVAGVGAFALYKIGKKFLNKPDKVKLPQGGQGLPVVSYDNSGRPIYWNPAPLSKELYDAMHGLFSGSATKDEAWTKLAELPSDDMVTATYNYFNDKYGNGDTLVKWIKDELWTDLTGSGKEMALNRLASIQLK